MIQLQNPVHRNQVHPTVLSSALLVCSAVWFTGAWCATSGPGSLSASPIFWLLIVMLMPAVCFALGLVLSDWRRGPAFSWFHRIALLSAVLPTTVGTFLSMWTVRLLFWDSFQNASNVIRVFAALATLNLVVVTGVIVWRSAVTGSSRQPPNDAPTGS